MNCNACKGCYHPATGHILNPQGTAVLCGPCARDFFKWLKGHTNRKWGKVSFYEQAETSRNKK